MHPARRQLLNHDFGAGSLVGVAFVLPTECPLEGLFLAGTFAAWVLLVFRAGAGAAFSVSSLRASEFMQYLRPVGGGPSWKTWPRCEPQRWHVTSTRASAASL